jgi:hypothetical protein
MAANLKQKSPSNRNYPTKMDPKLLFRTCTTSAWRILAFFSSIDQSRDSLRYSQLGVESKQGLGDLFSHFEMHRALLQGTANKAIFWVKAQGPKGPLAANTASDRWSASESEDTDKTRTAHAH